MSQFRTVSMVVGLCLLGGILTGCSFFGGQETAYTYWEPALSPDGTTLAYESTSEAGLELYVMDLETGAERQITNNEDPDWSPMWSPDGERIVFSSSREKNVDIYLLNVSTLEDVRLTTHEADDINPSWGGNGLIYFNSNRDDSWEIYSIDPDTLTLRKITSPQSSAP